MSPLITLIFRILSGEKFETSTQKNTAYWLSAMVVVPIAIVGFAFLAKWLESVIGLILDNTFSLILFSVGYGLITLGSLYSLARIGRGHPRILLLFSVGAWGMMAFSIWRAL